LAAIKRGIARDQSRIQLDRRGRDDPVERVAMTPIQQAGTSGDLGVSAMIWWRTSSVMSMSSFDLSMPGQ
jgi:hypothetical protein